MAVFVDRWRLTVTLFWVNRNAMSEKVYDSAAAKQKAYRERVRAQKLYVGRQKPAEATDGQWAYALERAERAKKYAAMFSEHVRTSELCFQDPLWQWENEARKRAL